MQIDKWGDTLAIRLPKEVVQMLDLKEGDDVELYAREDGHIGMILNGNREWLLERMRLQAKPLPKDWKFDREEANGL